MTPEWWSCREAAFHECLGVIDEYEGAHTALSAHVARLLRERILEKLTDRAAASAIPETAGESEGVRHCMFCNADIRECMGFTLARDVLACLEGSIVRRQVREICGRCMLQFDKGELRYDDIPAVPASSQTPTTTEPSTTTDTEPDFIGSADVRTIALLMDLKRREAIDAKRGVMLSWADANGFALTLHAAAKRMAELEEPVFAAADRALASMDTPPELFVCGGTHKPLSEAAQAELRDFAEWLKLPKPERADFPGGFRAWRAARSSLPISAPEPT